MNCAKSDGKLTVRPVDDLDPEVTRRIARVSVTACIFHAAKGTFRRERRGGSLESGRGTDEPLARARPVSEDAKANQRPAPAGVLSGSRPARSLPDQRTIPWHADTSALGRPTARMATVTGCRTGFAAPMRRRGPSAWTRRGAWRAAPRRRARPAPPRPRHGLGTGVQPPSGQGYTSGMRGKSARRGSNAVASAAGATPAGRRRPPRSWATRSRHDPATPRPHAPRRSSTAQPSAWASWFWWEPSGLRWWCCTTPWDSMWGGRVKHKPFTDSFFGWSYKILRTALLAVALAWFPSSSCR